MANEFEVRNGIISLGGVTFPLTKIGNTYSILETDNFIEVTGGTFNVTLPDSIGIKGKFFQIKNNGNGTFTDVSSSSGSGITMDAMSTTIGDYNSDGFLDIY